MNKLKTKNNSFISKTGVINIEAKLRGKSYQFHSKPGVFSKNRIDRGTQLLTETMVIDDDDVVLDLGCGYGVIGIVAADLAPNGKVYLVDSDIRAVNLAKENVKLNNVRNAEVLITDCLEAVREVKFDKIVTYPPTHSGDEVIEEFIRGSKLGLKFGGTLFVVTLSRLAPYFKRKIENIFENVAIAKHSKTHTVFQARK